MMENDNVLKLINDALTKNDFTELNSFVPSHERPKEIETIRKLIEKCIDQLKKSG